MLLLKIEFLLRRLFRRILKKPSDDPRLYLTALVLVSFAVFAAYGILRHLGLWTLYYDLGVYSNSIWRTTHGYDSWASLVFPSPNTGSGGPGHIGHLSPILGLVAIVYYAFPDPETLLVIQAAVLASSAVPLYLTALQETRRATLSLVVAGTYLLNPGLHGIARYDFHVESFLPLFIFFVYLFVNKRQYRMYCLSLGLMLATIDFSAVIGVGIALAIRLEKKHIDKYSLTAAALSASLLVVIVVSATGLWGWPTNWPIRQLQQGSPGAPPSFSEWFIGILRDPLSLLLPVGYDLGMKLLYLASLLIPAALGIVRYHVRILPALPWIAILLTSLRPSFYSLDYQYSAFVIPFAYLAAIPFLHKIYTPNRAASVIAVATTLMLLSSALSPVRLPMLQPFAQNSGWPQVSPLIGTINTIRETLPANATILTQIDVFPQIANKPFATINYSMPSPPKFIVVNTDSPWYDWSSPALGIWHSAHEQSDRLIKDHYYVLLVSNRGLLLYRLVA
jgi:uncharacterized membrane protein